MDIEQIKEGDLQAYLLFLDELREIGICNMFGAIPYLQEEFTELDNTTAKNVLAHWMHTFGERHPE